MKYVPTLNENEIDIYKHINIRKTGYLGSFIKLKVFNLNNQKIAFMYINWIGENVFNSPLHRKLLWKSKWVHLHEELFVDIIIMY